MTFDRGHGYAQFSGDLWISQAIDLRQQKGAFDLTRQTVEQLIQLHQGLQDDRLVFFRRRDHVRHLRQGVEVSAFDILTAVMIEQNALGQRRQKGARLDDHRRFAGGQHLDKRVLRQIRRAVRAAEFAPQPTDEPAVMGLIERFDRMGGRQRYYSGRLMAR
ncbi:hypothetical protein D3C81_1266460 [compost metagenome]